MDGGPEPSDSQTRELQQFMESENQKAVIQAAISKLTDICFDKCVDRPGATLDSSQANCVANCAGRFLDSSVFVVNRMMASAPVRRSAPRVLAGCLWSAVAATVGLAPPWPTHWSRTVRPSSRSLRACQPEGRCLLPLSPVRPMF